MSTPEAQQDPRNEDKETVEEVQEVLGTEEEEQEQEQVSSTGAKTKPTIGVEDEESEEKKEKKEEAQQDPNSAQPATQHDWQAIYSPQYNAYYFYNAKTQETTWTNPLVPDAPESASSVAPVVNPQTASAAPTSATNPTLDGIDPELAYLDPSLAAGGPSNPAGAYSARFNARTGRFTALDGRDPSHVSEYERMKRMSEVFFDMSAWEQDVAARKTQEAQDDAEGKRRKKKPTKADLERFKAQKEARKKTKYAWLRE